MSINGISEISGASETIRSWREENMPARCSHTHRDLNVSVEGNGCRKKNESRESRRLSRGKRLKLQQFFSEALASLALPVPLIRYLRHLRRPTDLRTYGSRICTRQRCVVVRALCGPLGMARTKKQSKRTATNTAMNIDAPQTSMPLSGATKARARGLVTTQRPAPRTLLLVGLIGTLVLVGAIAGLRWLQDSSAAGCVVRYRGETLAEDGGAFRERLVALRTGAPETEPRDTVGRRVFWAAFVGDSIARNVLVGFMQKSGVDTGGVTFERHRDFEHVADEVRWTLHWAPFPGNATAVVGRWWSDRTDGTDGTDGDQGSGGMYTEDVPDVIVLSASLWHVLWVHDVDGYRDAVGGMLEGGRRASERGDVGAGARVVVLNAPRVYGGLLEDERKRKYMTEERIDGYNGVLEAATCAAGGGLRVVDVHGATEACGVACSVDGIHSREDVYKDRLVPMVLNGLATSRS